MKTAPQRDLGAEVVKELPWFGRKSRLNVWFRPKNPSQFRWRPFFGDHLFLGGKTVWMFDFGRKIRLNFGEDLFFFFFFWRSPCFWAEKPPQSDSRAMKICVKVTYICLNLPKKPPPLNEILATRLEPIFTVVVSCYKAFLSIFEALSHWVTIKMHLTWKYQPFNQ